MGTRHYTPFDWGHNHKQLEDCFDLAKSKLGAMYPQYTLLSSDMFGIDIYNDNTDTVVAQYSTGITNDNLLAMQNIDTKEVCIFE